MTTWNTLPSPEVLDKTVTALTENNFEVQVVPDSAAAKKAALALIPTGSEVMTMTSITLDTLGLTDELNQADGQYRPVRDQLYSMNKETQAQEMNRLGAAPEYAIGSVHAVTQDGHVLIASNTGSQLPAYVYSALNVVWVVGAQKIVATVEEGIKRVYEHSLPLESERAHIAYGVKKSAVNKLLIYNTEVKPGRVKIIMVQEVLGY